MPKKEKEPAPYKEIGARFKELRRRDKLTQPDIEEITGFAVTTISLVENGFRMPQQELLIKMSNARKWSIDYILTGISPEDSKARRPNISSDVEARLLALEGWRKGVEMKLAKLLKQSENS